MSKTLNRRWHITPNGENGWKVLREGGEAPSARLSTKREAAKRGKEIAENQNGSVIYHNALGQFSSR